MTYSFAETVDLPAGAEERLDKYVAAHAGGVSRAQLKAHAVSLRVNGEAAKLATPVTAGDAVEAVWESVPVTFEPEDLPLDVLYDDERVTVVNKAQGMVTHPGADNWTGTLANALLFRWGMGASDSPRPPGIVHRLDKDTSGVIITAKDEGAAEWLRTEFAERRVKKEYVAVVTGRLPAWEGRIATRIIRDPQNKTRYKGVPLEDTESGGGDAGKIAITVYRCVAKYGPFTLLRLGLKTGRTHQIRVHMRYLGCPILGDVIYGRRHPAFPQATLMLHSRLLGIRLPGKEEESLFRAPIPPRFEALIDELRRRYARSAPNAAPPRV